jgi:hypothetical protein
VKIGYLTFGRDDFSYGMALCLNSLADKKYEIYRITPKTAKYVDVLLFSCFWWEHIYLLADFLRKAGIKKGEHPRIVVGGFNMANPMPFEAYADAVVCGDGEDVLDGVINGHNPGYLWHNTNQLIAFCHETNGIARIEIARGCRYRCKFCAVAHLKPYREVAPSGIADALARTKYKRVSLFAPEPTLHGADEELTQICHRLGKMRVDSDVRLDRLNKRSDSVPRVGIEGLSERLRRSINKPYSDQKIIDSVKAAIQSGRKGLFMYIILDLPGEGEQDWQEFKTLLTRIGELPGSSDFILKPSPSVFMPSPHTPMEYEAINWNSDYAGKWSAFFGRGKDREWDVIMAERSRVFSPGMRVLSMLSTRCGEEFAEIESRLSRDRIIGISGGRVQCKSLPGLIRVLNDYGGVEKYCGKYQPKDAPWKSLRFENGNA